jgi:hypothetical protein
MLFNRVPQHLHKSVREMTDVQLLKAMDLVKLRMKFLSDIDKHLYLFEDPELGNKKINLELIKEI